MSQEWRDVIFTLTVLAIGLVMGFGFGFIFGRASVRCEQRIEREVSDGMDAVQAVACPHCTRPAGYPCSSWDAARHGLWSAVRTHPSRIKLWRRIAPPSAPAMRRGEGT